MKYSIITNNNKVFNFYKETDSVVFLQDSSINEILEFVNEKCFEGHQLLSDPILYNLENQSNPFKSILIGKDILKDNSHSIKMTTGVLDLIEKVKFSPKEDLTEIELEEFRFVDLNLIRNSIEKLIF
nr:GrdX family protein [uncultured Cetobacterium sp.]